MDTSPGTICGYGFSDGITDVVYRANLGYIPGFQLYVLYVKCKTELLSSAGNIIHSTPSFSSCRPSRGIIYIFSICVGEGGRLTRVTQRCWPRAEFGHPGLSIVLKYSREVARRHTGNFEFEGRGYLSCRWYRSYDV